VDLHLNEFSKTGIASGNTKSILNQLNFTESETLDECFRLYEQAKENCIEMIDLTRANLLENGKYEAAFVENTNNNGSELTDDELNMKLIQMKNAHQSSSNNLNSLRDFFTQNLAKEKTYLDLHASLKEFILNKSNQLENSQSQLSAQLSKITEERQAHESFTHELNSNSDEIKRLIEYYNNKIIESDDEYVNVVNTQIINDIENSWNNLCAKSDARKEKLYVNFSMAEQFESVHSFLTNFVQEMNTSLKNQLSVEDTKAKLAELNDEKKLNLTKLCKIGNELIQACQLDKEQIHTRTNELTQGFADLENELNHMQAVGEALNSYNAIRNDLKRNINLDEKMLEEKLKPKLDELKGLLLKDAAKVEKTNTILNDLNESYTQLESKIIENNNKQAKFTELQQEFSNMDETLKDIHSFLSNDSVNTDTNLEDDIGSNVDAKKKKLDEIKSTLENLNDHLNNANDSLNNHLKLSEVDMNNDSTRILKQLQETVRNLTEKCSLLKNMQQKEEEFLQEQSNLLNLIETQIQQCNADIVKCSQDFKSRSVNLDDNNSTLSISQLVNEHEKYESNHLKPIKETLDQINKDSSTLKGSKSLSVNQFTALELKIEKLSKSFGKLEALFKERAVQLDLAMFKSSKFEDKIRTLNQNLDHVEANLKSLKILFNFDNLAFINTHLGVCDDLIQQLVVTSSEIDEFKEICEKIMQNCENRQERDVIEKRMEDIIYRWNILTRQLDEKHTNLTFLNLHLNELSDKYNISKAFVDGLNLKYTSNLTLNCVEPIVIKSQHEKMRELNKLVDDHFFDISELKLDASNLISLNRDFDRVDDVDELDEESTNRYLPHLPKTISSSAVQALVSMLNCADIESRVDETESKYANYKFSLNKNLNLMQSLYPLCEKFSHTIVQLNQSFSKFEAELVWLQAANDNETTLKDKEDIYDEIKRGVRENEDVIINLEGPLSARIMEELSDGNEENMEFCQEFIEDLNNNINQAKVKYDDLNEKLDQYAKTFEARRLKTKEFYSELDDLLEWLDEVDNKFANLDGISYEPDTIESQLNEQLNLNEQVDQQKIKLKELTDKSKRLIRVKQIDDSIELKEKLNSLQVQSSNLVKMGTIRLGEIEQALAIAKNFFESYNLVTNWFDEIGKELEESKKHHIFVSADTESKEMIKLELSLLKNIDRSLQEKKVEFENMNKNAIVLIKICNKNSGLMPAASYISLSETNSNGKDSRSSIQLKNLVSFADQKYESFKQIVSKRKEELESLLWKSAEFADKLDNLTNNLNSKFLHLPYNIYPDHKTHI
jgi:DNA repair exonuclease SbcCD ATPase subunit